MLASPAFCGGNWSLGAGALISENAYRQTKANKLVIPLVSYQGKYLSLYGPFIKLRYPVNKQNIIGVRFQIGLQDFNPKDASNAQMQQLQKRERLFYFGPFYRYRSHYGDMIASAAADVTGRSHGGFYGNLTYSYPFNSQDYRFFLRPSVGLEWSNNKLNQHFYQVTSQEATQSGFQAYQPQDGVSPFVGLFAGIRLTKRLFWTNIVRANYLPNTISNSPMVNGKHFRYSLVTGLTFEVGDSKQRFNH